MKINLFIRLASGFVCKKNSKILNFTSLVSVLGVAFGVAAFLVTITILNSFEAQMKHIVSSVNPNVIVFSPSGISHVDEYQKKIKSLIPSFLEKQSLFIYQESVMGLGRQTSAVYIRAIEGLRSASASELEKYIFPKNALKTLDVQSPIFDLNQNNLDSIDNQKELPHVILGKELSENLSAHGGSVVTLMTFNVSETGPAIRYDRFYVTGIINMGISQYDKQMVLMNFDDARKLFGTAGWASGIEIKLKNANDALGVSENLRAQMPWHVVAWQEIDKGLFFQIERDSTAIKFIVLIISFVAGFNIIVTLSLTVIDRSKQIALLRSLGAKKSFVIGVFVAAGTLLGFIGSVCGILFGLILLWVFSGIPLGDLQKFYYLEKIPVQIDVGLVAVAFFTAVFLSFLGALYPAFRAARVSPLVGLKA